MSGSDKRLECLKRNIWWDSVVVIMKIMFSCDNIKNRNTKKYIIQFAYFNIYTSEMNRKHVCLFVIHRITGFRDLPTVVI